MNCPDCENRVVALVGPSLSFGQYAGGVLVTQAYGAVAIYRCGRCQLAFKSPPLDLSETYDLYNQVDGTVWASRMPRPEFDLAQEIIKRRDEAGKRILDVGCNRGEFLLRIGTGIKGYGVEVNRNAAAFAESQGITVWPSLSSIQPGTRFSVITCFDVIEHLPRPAAFVRQLLGLLEPAGVLILSSGDAAVFLSQPRPALNWYFSNPEHISFISEDWVRRVLADSSEFVLNNVTRFVHGWHRPGIVVNLRVRFFKQWPRTYLRAYTLAKRVRGSEKSGLFVPGNGAVADHACFVIENAARKCA